MKMIGIAEQNGITGVKQKNKKKEKRGIILSKLIGHLLSIRRQT